MRHRILLLLLTLAFLTGCTAREEADRASAVQSRYAALLTYEAAARVELVGEGESVAYDFLVRAGEEETVVEVVSPKSIAGVRARLRGESLALSYDTLVLDAAGAYDRVNAVNCIPLTVRALAGGYLVERGEERMESGETAFRLALESDCGGETYLYAVRLAADDTPLDAEVSRAGQVFLRIEFTDLIFGDIMVK